MSLLMLAEAATNGSAEAGGSSVMSGIPTQVQLVDSLMDLAQHRYGAVLAVVLFACGLVYMLQGWKIFKVLVVINVGIIGALVGNYLGSMATSRPNTWVYTSIAGALLFGGLAWPLMKYAVSLLGGLVGAFVGYGLWCYVAQTIDRPESLQYAWIGGIVGLITLGLLAFVVLKIVVMFITSLQGAVMAVAGVLAMLLKYMPDDLRQPLSENEHLMLILISVPTIIGFVFQVCWSRPPKKKDGK